MFAQKSFNRDILNIYKTQPETVRAVFSYNMVRGDINRRDRDDNNILHIVAKNGDHDTMKELLDYIMTKQQTNVNMINHQNADGDTPLHISTRENYNKISNLLYKTKMVNVDLVNNNGEKVEAEDSESDSDKQQITNVIHVNNVFQHEMSAKDVSELYDQLRSDKRADDFSTTSVTNTEMQGSRSVERTATPTFSVTELKPPQRQQVAPQQVAPQQVAPQQVAPQQVAPQQVVKQQQSPFERSDSTDSAPAPELNALLGGSKKTDAAHKAFVAMLMKDMGLSEEDARAVKWAVWRVIKNKYPKASGEDKTKTMEQLGKDKKFMKDMIDQKDKLLNELNELRASNPIVKTAKQENRTQVKKARKSKKEVTEESE